MNPNFIQIQPFKLPADSRQSHRDLQAIITVSGRFIKKDVDLLAWTSNLEAYCLIDQQECRELQRKLTSCDGSRSDEFLEFLQAIVRSVPFDDFVNIVYKQGMVGYAEELNKVRYGPRLFRMGTIEVPFGVEIQKYYCSMKANVDNGVFKDPREYLASLTREYKENLETSDDQDLRQYYAEKVVALFVLRLPMYPTVDARKALLDDMKTTFHGQNADQRHSRNRLLGVDSRSADVVYASKMAITAATAGDFKTAREYSENAEHLSELNSSSLAKTLAYHDHQVIHLMGYWKTGNTEYLSNNLRIGDKGLRVIQDEPDDVRHQWNRLMMLYKVMSLLGIHPNFRMTDRYPSPKQIEQAKEVLQHVRRSFDGIETRREIFYSLCVARAHERTDPQEAITYVKRAIRLSSDRTDFSATETAHLRTYLTKLMALHKRQQLLVWVSEMFSLFLRGCGFLIPLLMWVYWMLFYE